MKRVVLNDKRLLLEAFQPKVDAIERLLLSEGLKPRLFETLRTPSRSQSLRKRGTSRARNLSMHCYGAAADIICCEHTWFCGRSNCNFFERLGVAAEIVGVWWGGNMFPPNRWTGKRFVDLPHVQAVPYRLQNRLKASKDFEGFVREVLRAESR